MTTSAPLAQAPAAAGTFDAPVAQAVVDVAPDLARRLVAEGLGTLLLVAAVVGSGIMAAKLSGGNVAVALLANTIATGAVLVVLITLFAPLSGAHFNPLVSGVMAGAGRLPAREAAAYMLVQVAGGCAGAVLANLMFELAPFQVATTLRGGHGQWLSEIVATFALFAAILGGMRHAPSAIPWLVGLTIVSAYWFTASTSFANPAVTIARMLSDSFAGIAPSSVPPFLVAQIIGAALASALFGWLLGREGRA
jgi:glycerol uptake facilitator-like aquaporin